MIRKVQDWNVKLKKDAIVITGFHGITRVITPKEAMKIHQPRKSILTKRVTPSLARNLVQTKLEEEKIIKMMKLAIHLITLSSQRMKTSTTRKCLEKYGKDMMVDVMEY